MGSSPTGPSKQTVDLLVGFLLWCIVKSMSIKEPSASKLRTAYKIVFWAGVAAFAAGVYQLVVIGISVNNLSNMIWFIIGQLMPAVAFGIAFFALRKNELWLRLYQATLAAVISTLLVGAIYNTVFTWLPAPFWPQSPVMSLLWFNLSPLFVWLLVMIAMFIAIKRQSNTINLTHLFQQMLVASVIFWVVMTIAQGIYMIVQQYPYNQNLSGHMPTFYGFGLILLLFLPAFITEKRRGSNHSLMTSILTGVVGGLAILAASAVIEPVVRLTGLLEGEASQWGGALVVTLCAVVVIAGYSWVYRHLRILAQ